jgi:hypothetical protein
MDEPDNDLAVVDAIKELNNRAWGAADQKLTVSGEVQHTFRDLLLQANAQVKQQQLEQQTNGDGRRKDDRTFQV